MSYDPKSLKAEDFINHEEILDTLAYADENKHNRELIEEILEKAKPRIEKAKPRTEKAKPRYKRIERKC